MDRSYQQFCFDDIPQEQRSYQSKLERGSTWPPIGDCLFGVPADKLGFRKPLIEIPDSATGFHFYLGESQLELFTSFLHSEHSEQVKRLYIGSSSYGSTGLDYSSLTEQLKHCDFPNLEVLLLGYWHLFCNAELAHGEIGCLDGLVDRMPALQELDLYGNWSLDSPLNSSALKRLRVEVETDSWEGVEPLSDESFSSLLSSSFPNLLQLSADVECEFHEKLTYSIPGPLLNGQAFPRLESLFLTGGFRKTDKQKLVDKFIQRVPPVEVHIDRRH